MNFIDIFLIIVILLSALNGWRRGFIFGLLDLLRWTGGILAAFLLYRPLGWVLSRLSGMEDIWSFPLAFVFTFFAAGLAIQYLGGLAAKRLPKEAHLSRWNKIAGALPGLVSGFVLAVIISACLYALPFSGDFRDQMRDSRLAENLSFYSGEMEAALTPIFEEALEQTIRHRLTNYPGSEETVELPFKVSKFEQRPDLEAEMLDLINRERREAGLAPLVADSEMRVVALKHSEDMFVRGYFAHNTPEGETPFDRMRADRVRFRTAGENLALAPTLNIAHTGLMNSPGHRANILRPQFGRVGIGILDGGRRGLMITQNFRN